MKLSSHRRLAAFCIALGGWTGQYADDEPAAADIPAIDADVGAGEPITA